MYMVLKIGRSMLGTVRGFLNLVFSIYYLI